MMRRVHLVLCFDVSMGAPVFVRVGIYGENAESLTTDLSGKTCLVDGPFGEGESFSEAKDKLLEDLKIHPFYNQWVFAQLGEQ